MRTSRGLKAGMALALLAFIAFVVWWSYFRSPTLGELRRAANDFRAPPKWTLIERRDHRRSPFCQDIDCPSVVRAWRTGDRPTRGEIEALASAAGWHDLTRSRGCNDAPARNTVICSVRARAHGLHVGFGFSGPEGGQYRVVLTIH
jgi:hypothetical protein